MSIGDKIGTAGIVLLNLGFFYLIIVPGGCGGSSTEPKNVGKNYEHGVNVVTVNECQYVTLYTDAITHAGNCNNPSHSKPIYDSSSGFTITGTNVSPITVRDTLYLNQNQEK